MESETKNRGLQVAGERGAASTTSRYGKAFLLAKIAEKEALLREREPEPEPEPDEAQLYRCSVCGAEGYSETCCDCLDAITDASAPSMRDILGPDGVIAQRLPGYETREPQILMAELVAEAIQNDEHAIIEAGTGSGKSFGYLIPAVYSGRKTVVSTGDRALQEQVWRKDVPFLRAVLPVAFKAAILKGRSNYLCLERWNDEIGDQQMFGASYEFAQIREWLTSTEAGDLEEWPFTVPPELHGKITATSDQCLRQHCPSYHACYAEKAHTLAEAADVIIVNHALLTLDAAIREKSNDFAKVIPNRDIVILDEAHRLEDAATLAFQNEVSLGGILHFLNDKKTKATRLDPVQLAKIELDAQAFFDQLAKISPQQTYSLGVPPQELRARAENLALLLLDLARLLEQQNPYLQEGGAKQEAFKRHVERVKAYAEMFRDVLFYDSRFVIYVEKRQGKRGQLVYLRKCPISVADDLRTALFDRWPVVCTSATLATGKTFEYFKSRVGCDEARELIVASPFDYGRNMLVYLPPADSMLDPTKYYQEGSPEYFDRLAEQIERLILAANGRCFALFTSNRALGEVYDRIAHRLRYLVLRQGSAPRPELLKRFIEDGHAVLFALKSFWEGIDVRGEALSVVIVDKLPFGQPDDPIYQARCDAIVRETGDKWSWFQRLALPSAMIALKQGVGRLIRTKDDWGCVALMDQRLTTKSYGTTVLRSLPPGTKVRSISDVQTFFRTREAPNRQGRLL